MSALCPVKQTTSRPMAAMSMGTAPADCEASTTHSAPAACAILATCATSTRLPVTLEACVTTTARVPGTTRRSSSAMSRNPWASQPACSTVTPRSSARRASGRSTELCSSTVVTTRSPGPTSPDIAALSAAVEFAEKHTWSERGQPRRRATASRQPQTTRPASSAPAPAPRPAFPSAPSAAHTASTTCRGLRSVVAALSR